MVRILLVCTGNTCRSPMAEALLKERIARSGLEDKIAVASAGLAAFGEFPASDGARAAAGLRGLSLDNHRSRQIGSADVRDATLVLTMTANHKAALLRTFPEAAGKTHTLAEFAGADGDISDPFGQDCQVYQACMDQLETLVDPAWKKIVEIAGIED